MNRIDEEKGYYDRVFDGLRLQNEHIEYKEFEDCVFQGCTFSETHFRGCKFLNCRFQSCRLSLIHVKDSAFMNVKHEDSEIIGVNWTEASWPRAGLHSIDFFKSVINHSTFTGLPLKRIHITGCVARNVDFAEADLTQADCTNTDFSQSRFLHTNLTQTDFTGAHHYTISSALNTLKKTKFSLPEAISLLHGLDIILDES